MLAVQRVNSFPKSFAVPFDDDPSLIFPSLSCFSYRSRETSFMDSWILIRLTQSRLGLSERTSWHFCALATIWITDSDKAACCLWFRILFALKRQLSGMNYAYKIESKGRKMGGWSICKWIYMSIPHCFALMYAHHGTLACCNDQLTKLLQPCRRCICYPLAMACPSACSGTSRRQAVQQV